MQVQPFEKAADHRALLRLAGVRPVAKACENDEIGALSQPCVGGEQVDQPVEVLLLDRPRDRQHHRPFGLAQEGRDQGARPRQIAGCVA